jgi:DNA-binding transcriptional MerR regulator
LGLSLKQAKEIIDMYDSPRDTGAQLQKFLQVLTVHRQRHEAQLKELQATLAEIKTQQREAQALLQALHANGADGANGANGAKNSDSGAAA